MKLEKKNWEGKNVRIMHNLNDWLHRNAAIMKCCLIKVATIPLVPTLMSVEETLTYNY